MTSTLRVFIVDDELHCRALLRNLLRDVCPETQIAGEAGSITEAAEALRHTRPDLLLLDISLPDGTGFDLLDRFPQPDFRVIFTTAHDEFALKAFRYSAVDYLLKPVDPDQLAESVHKAGRQTPAASWHLQLAQLRNQNATGNFDRIALNTGDGLLFIQTSDILYLEANGNFTYAYLSEGERHLVSNNLKMFEEILPEPGFFRIHQSYLVNTQRVKKFLKEDGGYVIMQDGAKLPLARRRKDDFLRGLMT
ncbi:MAG: response regulator transcription factor [Saprospiraceae bacterium]|nr:response regulator transcription factor [Saprospiraceae bacterium]